METVAHTDLTPRSAGRLTTKKIPITHPASTVGQVIDEVLKDVSGFDALNYIYVVTKEGKLDGTLSIREVFRSPRTKPVTEIMTRDVITVRPHTDQDRVAFLAIEHHIKEVPVVDGEGRFEGVVPFHTILAILRSEHLDDALRMAGVHRFTDPAQTILTASAFTLVKKRLPWLIIGLLGSSAAAAIINSFEGALRAEILLAAFIPAVTYISDAAGTQSETIVVRTMAISRTFEFGAYFLRELKTGFLLAIPLAATIAGVSFLLWHTGEISIILGISFFFAILASMTTATVLPWIFRRFRVDPAILSGPLDTIVSDLLSISIYFAVANLILRLLS